MIDGFEPFCLILSPKWKFYGVILTEDASKNAMIMTIIMWLGYDVFNSFDVVPDRVKKSSKSRLTSTNWFYNLKFGISIKWKG